MRSLVAKIWVVVVFWKLWTQISRPSCSRHPSRPISEKEEWRERQTYRKNEVANLMTEKRDRQTNIQTDRPCRRSERCWNNVWKAKFGWRIGLEEGSNKFFFSVLTVFCVEKMNVFFKIISLQMFFVFTTSSDAISIGIFISPQTEPHSRTISTGWKRAAMQNRLNAT
jgi:hypothetical protein